MSFYDQNFPDLLVEKKDKVLWVSLNRPQLANAISLEMIASFEKLLPHADADFEVELIVLTGSGKNFCSGGNLKDMKSQSGMFAGESIELRSAYEFGIQKIPKLMEALSTPIIAQVNGAAVGAGCDLAMMCDLRIGDRKTKFSETFARLGLVPGDGGTFFLARVLGYSKAMEMFLTSSFIKGREAKDYGLLNFYTDEDISIKTVEVVESILKNSSIALSFTKKVLKHSYPTNLNTQLEMLSSFQSILQKTDDHMSRLENV